MNVWNEWMNEEWIIHQLVDEDVDRIRDKKALFLVHSTQHIYLRKYLIQRNIDQSHESLGPELFLGGWLLDTLQTESRQDQPGMRSRPQIHPAASCLQ